ncbi:hypothetical protein I302_107278 [Kwoniella bestiolae CBS 10118]|uniref:Uncharacterized protein n=1 Tax=Kwoniella bestiolae CBS 10118 TaxID=1296100 RepID=A0A1B9FZ17_9TREE|nr:hypothetical protein I302_06986 [Kwoniella bestiolae CBS 10118]OCF24000.1 hypothetical protein I302_06986 [Kwoniella bestiolae CBS 10118]
MRFTSLTTTFTLISLLPSILAMQGKLTVLIPDNTYSQKRASHGGELLGGEIKGGKHEWTFTEPGIEYVMWEGPDRIWHQECSVWVGQNGQLNEDIEFELRNEKAGFKGDMSKPVHILCEEAHCNSQECVIPHVNSIPPKEE